VIFCVFVSLQGDGGVAGFRGAPGIPVSCDQDKHRKLTPWVIVLSVVILAPFLSQPHHHSTVREELSLDVRLVSLCQACFHSSVGEVLGLDVRLVSLFQAYFLPFFLPSLLEVLRLDVRLVSLCQAYLLPSFLPY